jgi:hypothetical protein
MEGIEGNIYPNYNNTLPKQPNKFKSKLSTKDDFTPGAMIKKDGKYYIYNDSGKLIEDKDTTILKTLPTPSSISDNYYYRPKVLAPTEKNDYKYKGINDPLKADGYTRSSIEDSIIAEYIPRAAKNRNIDFNNTSGADKNRIKKDAKALFIAEAKTKGMTADEYLVYKHNMKKGNKKQSGGSTMRDRLFNHYYNKI